MQALLLVGHFNPGSHLFWVKGAEVLEGAGGAEGLGVAGAWLENAGIEGVVAGSYGVGDFVNMAIDPIDCAADFDRQSARKEGHTGDANLVLAWPRTLGVPVLGRE